MITVEIYSKNECHLCDVAKEVLTRVQHKHPFELKEIIIREGDEHFEQYNERIPVVVINKKLAFQFRVQEQEFISLLEQERMKTP